MESIKESASNIQTKLNEWRHKDRRCESCIQQLCGESDVSKCSNPYKCDCKCGVGSTQDNLKKAATIGTGVALFAGGTALAIMAAPIALPAVIVGGIIGSAGASAAIHGVQKTISKEKINKSNLTFDVSVGAVAGLLTAGIGCGVGAVTTAVGGVATTTAKVGVSAGTGVLNGITSKAVNETANVAVGDKEWEDWGQSGTGRKRDTLKAWTIPVATGAIGGFVGVSTDNVAKVAVDISSRASTNINPDAVTGLVTVGGVVVKEGANWGVKKALAENPDDITAVDLALATGTAAGFSAVNVTCKDLYTMNLSPKTPAATTPINDPTQTNPTPINDPTQTNPDQNPTTIINNF